MRTFAAVVVAVLIIVDGASGSMWMYPVGADGVATRPGAYLRAIDGCEMKSCDLAAYGQGTPLNGVDLGGMGMQVLPAPARVFAQTGPANEPFVMPRPVVAYVSGYADEPSTIIMTMLEPTTACSFIVMGLRSNMNVTVYDTEQRIAEQRVVQDISEIDCMWVGLSDAGRLMREVRLTPALAGDFALGDFESGVHHPEPATASLFLLAAFGSLLRRRYGAAA